MTIDPIQSGPAFGHGRVHKTDAPEPAASPDRRDAPVQGDGDSVELSPLGRQVADRIRAEGPPGLEVAADRLRAIAERLSSGYYNSPEVRDHVAQSILNELRGG